LKNRFVVRDRIKTNNRKDNKKSREKTKKQNMRIKEIKIHGKEARKEKKQ